MIIQSVKKWFLYDNTHKLVQHTLCSISLTCGELIFFKLCFRISENSRINNFASSKKCSLSHIQKNLSPDCTSNLESNSLLDVHEFLFSTSFFICIFQYIIIKFSDWLWSACCCCICFYPLELTNNRRCNSLVSVSFLSGYSGNSILKLLLYLLFCFFLSFLLSISF